MVSSKWVAVVAAITLCVGAGMPSMAAVTGTTSTAAAESSAIAKINGKTVTEAELTSFALQLEMTEGRRLPSQEALLDEYVLTELYEQIPTTATVQEKDSPESPSPYDLVMQRGVLKRELRDWISKNVDVPRADMEKWFEQNSSRYTKPERVHAWHLFLETSDDTESSSPEKVKARLQELKTQVDAGTSFSETAKKYSEAASGQAGGEIGMITRRMPIGPLSKPMNIELEEAFFALPVGKVSDVVETRHGMHLLYVTDKETTLTPSVDDLITSGILPGALAQDRLTSEIKTLVSKTISEKTGEVLPGYKEGGEVTTDTVAFRLDGKDYTIGNLKSVFGPRFSGYLEQAQQSPDMLRELLQQAIDDEAMLLAAVDKGIDKQSEIASQLEAMAKRTKAGNQIEAIVMAESAVSDAEVQRRYNELKDELRQPVAEGSLLLIKSEQATGTAEQARAREYARRKADEIRARLEKEEFSKVAEELKAEGKDKVVVAEVPEHVIGQTTVTESRIFDQAISGITENSGLSQVVPMGADYAIAKLNKKSPGQPVPLEVVRDRLASLIENETQMAVRGALVDRLVKKGLVEFLPAAAKYGKTGAGSTGDASTTATE